MEGINLDRVLAIYGEKYLSSILLFREIALEIDADPNRICTYYNHSKALLERSSVFEASCYDTVRTIEAYSYGDASVCMACPSTSLSGLLLKELGDENQINTYLKYCKNNPGKTFFALTEPNKGSDISTLRTTSYLKNEKIFVVNGEKTLVGGLAIGNIGVLITQLQDKQNFNSFLITKEILEQKDAEGKSKVFRRELNMIGLRGAQLGYARFTNLEIPYGNLLGRNLSPLKRGISAILKTFNRKRPSVAAMAVGFSQSIVDFHEIVNKKNKQANFYKKINLKIQLARDYLYFVAKNVDNSPCNTAQVSEIKLISTKLLEEIFHLCLQNNNHIFLEHQLMKKWYRDVLAFEFMEGAEHVHKDNVYLNILRSKNTGNRDGSVI